MIGPVSGDGAMDVMSCRSLKTYYEEDSNDMGTRSKQKLASISVEETKPSESKCCS